MSTTHTRTASHASRVLLGTATLLLVACSQACAEIATLGPPPDAPNIDLVISKTVNVSTPAVGATVIYTITARNNGPLAATEVSGGDTLPSGLVYVSHNSSIGNYNANSGLWSIGDLGIGAQATLTITATVAAGTGGQAITNGAGVVSLALNDSVQANNIATATVNVQGTAPPPPPAGVTFASTWGTATGNSQNALSDGGRWDDIYCGSASSTLTVVAGSTVGWTKTPNVLRLQQLGESTCGTLEKVAAVPASTTHWGRFYFRNNETQTTHNHVTTYNPVGQIQLAFWNRRGTSTGVEIFMRTYFRGNGTASAYPYDLWNAGTSSGGQPARLTNGTWYRFEWQIEHVTATSYRIWPRIYNMAGTLLYDASSYYQNDYPSSGNHSLASFYAAGNTFGFTSTSLGRRLGLGNEGPATSASSGGYWYQADVAISTAGWIGQ